MPPPVDARSCRSSAAGTRDPHTAGRLHQPVQVLAQARVMLDGALPAASRMADAALRGPYGRLAQLPYAAANRPARSSGGPCNRCLATTPGRRRLSGKHQPPHPLVHNGGNRLVTSLNRSFNYHPLSISEHVVKNKLFRDSALAALVISRPGPQRHIYNTIDIVAGGDGVGLMPSALVDYLWIA